MDKGKKTAELITVKKELVSQNEEKKTSSFINILSADIAKTAKEEEYISHLVAIVEFSDDAIISKSLDGIIKTWNKGSEKMFGYTAKQAVGKNISLIIPSEYVNEEKNILERISNNEIINHYETIRRKKNGEQFYVSLTVSPLKDQRGNIIGISKIVRDITLQKKAAQLIIANRELIFQSKQKEKRALELATSNKHLKKTEEQLTEANKELESFSYSVSHDLRAPLRAIHGYTKMLKSSYGTTLDLEGNRLMDNITENAKKMGQLIDDLLDFSRIGRTELAKMNINMHELVTNICNELKKEQTDQNIEFDIQHLSPAWADYSAIKQIWLNLISNAIKYSRYQEKTIIEIGSRIIGNEIIYHIKDNGAGFDMRYADKLFGVFQRLHSDEEFEGTGVGLALVQRLLFKHGSRVWGEGKINEGATFYFTLHKAKYHDKQNRNFIG